MSKFQAHTSFTSKHGHQYVKGVIIGGLRYSFLDAEDQVNFVRLHEQSTMGVKAPVIHHTTHHVVYDDDPFYSPVAGFPIMPAIDMLNPTYPVWSTPDDYTPPPPVEQDFGGGSGGGAGAGDSWSDPGSTSASDTSSADSSTDSGGGTTDAQ